MADADPILVGDVWQHRREPWRKVAIKRVEPERTVDYDQSITLPARVQVTRNTSRRRQAILVRTLRKDYRLLSGVRDVR